MTTPSTTRRAGATAPLPVAVIGAGPVGLAAAAHLIDRGLTPLLFEAGASVGHSVRAWGHVRMFSPWQYNVDRAAAGLLAASGWVHPDPDALPTGRELVDRYLEPLSMLPQIRPHLHLGTRVLAVGRDQLDKVRSAGRAAQPFVLHVEDARGERGVFQAQAVIDASGTWQSPNPLGAGGIPVPGEAENADCITYGIPDVLHAERARYAGRRVLVVGGGHSAANALLDLAQLRQEEPATEIVWAIRRKGPERTYGGEEADALAARGHLGARLHRLVDRGGVRLVSSFSVTHVGCRRDDLLVSGYQDGAYVTLNVDQVIVATGFRPDLSFLREVRLSLDPALESASALAPLIDPNLHSCGTVRPHGERELRQPDASFYIAGMKSYGRAPTFLLATGYEQVRSIAAALVGDREAADRVELNLPETGVCSTDFATLEAGAALGLESTGDGAACCGVPSPAPAVATVGAEGSSCCARPAPALAQPVGAGASACCTPAPEPRRACCG